jgi:type II secretory pathway component PulM
MKSNVVQLNEAVLSMKVDRLAVLKAQIADLSSEADEIKTALLAGGKDEYEGRLHKAVIKHSIRESLVSERVRERLTEAQYAECLRATPVHSVCLYGRVA